MKKRLTSILLALTIVLTLSGAAYAAEPDYQTVLISQLEAGTRPSVNNLFFGIAQWKDMDNGPQKVALAERYAAIKKLDMSSMGLKQKGSGSTAQDDLSLLEPFTGLEELDLSTKPDTSDDYKNTLNNLNLLENLTGLKKLDVSGNQLQAKRNKTDGISGLKGCVRLESLNLSGNPKLGSTGQITDALTPLAQLPNLTELNLSGTGFSDGDVQSVQSIVQLRTLDISDTPVKNLDLSGMAGLTSLTAENLTLDSLTLPAGLTDLNLSGTKLKVRNDNMNDAVAVMNYYGQSGLKLVNASNTSQEFYTINVDSTANGTADVSVKAAAKGTKVTVTITPNPGYTQDSVAISYQDADGTTVTKPVTDGQFTMPDANVTVTASFMPLNVRINYNTTDQGSVSFSSETPARGERVRFDTHLSKGFQVREITAGIGSKSVPVYRSEDGTYCFDMPRLKEGQILTFNVAIVEVVTPRYSRSGASGGQLTLSGLVPGQQYVCQMSEAESSGTSSGYTIVTFTAQDTSERIEVRASTKGYLVSLWKYDAWADSVEDLVNVLYEAPTNK